MTPRCDECDADGVWECDVCRCPQCGEQLAHRMTGEELAEFERVYAEFMRTAEKVIE